MSFGENFKKILKENNLKIKEVHEGTQISLNTLYSITKRNTNIPNQETLRKIVTYLQKNIGPEITVETLIPGYTKQIVKNPEDQSSFNETEIVCKTNMNISEIKNLPKNRAFQKHENGEPLDPEEQQALDSFKQSGGFQRAFKDLSESTRKLADILRENYELLNEEGQKKADKHIEYATEQIEMLTKIPEYQKKDD